MSNEPKPHEYPLVLIDWHDAYGCSPDWEDLTDIDAHPITCRSVGWLVQDRDECIVIVPHRAGSEGFAKLDGDGESAGKGCGDMTIPRRAVTRITNLDEQAGEDHPRPQHNRLPPHECPACNADRTDVETSSGNTRYACGSGIHPQDDLPFVQGEKCCKRAGKITAKGTDQ